MPFAVLSVLRVTAFVRFGALPGTFQELLTVADCTASAFEDETSDGKLRRLTTAKRALAECMYCLWLADEEGRETLKIRIAADLVRIHLESYIKTLTR